MIARSRVLCRSLRFAVWLALMGLAPSLQAVEAGTPVSVARRWDRQLERLDRELARRWEQTQADRIVDGRRAPHRLPEGSSDASKEIVELRRWLELLDLRIRTLADPQSRPLRAKVRSLGRRLDNLELALSGRTPPLERPFSVSISGSAARAGSPRIALLAAAATGSNLCTAAPPIGDGTFAGTTVGATNDGAATCGSSAFSPDVWFRYVAPASGLVSMDTFGSGYDTVLSVHTGCPGSGFELGCNDDAFGLQSAISFNAQLGVSYWVRVSGFDGATGPFELHVGPGGAVSGTVTETPFATPVGTGEVSVLIEGFTVQSSPLAPDGTYDVGGLSAGVYTVRTENEQGALDEVWNDHPCTGGLLCDPEVGDPVAVESRDTTTGIDFSLARGGEIAGVVRRAANGDPVPDIRIEAWTVPDLVLAAASVSGADGSYSLGGLATGSYLVFAESPEFTDQLYDDVTCPGGFEGFNPGCDASDGSEVAVTLGATTAGIDFDLVRLGILEGTVTEGFTGAPIEAARVEAESPVGPSVSTLTDATGAFRIAGLPTGTYYLKATDFELVPEVYREIPCANFCNITEVGTPVPLTLGQVVTDLDFTLEPYGSIAGRLTDAETGVPVHPSGSFGYEIQVFGSDGLFEQRGFVDASGNYRVFDLPEGQHFVRTDSFASPHLDELYDDLPCYRDCDVTIGTPVTVVAGAETPNIDFALDRGGIIRGKISDALTGGGLSGRVTIFDLEGNSIQSGVDAPSDGLYSAENLPPGSYLLEADPFSLFYVGQLFDRVSCLRGLLLDCQPEQGTPVEVELHSTVSGIDFPLVRKGSISGRVTDAVTGAAVTSGDVVATGVTGDLFGTEFLGPDGRYTILELPPGDYLVHTSTHTLPAGPIEYVDEAFDDQPCDVGCDLERLLSIGTPVRVTAGTDTPGVDFQLDPKRAIAGRVFEAATGLPLVGAFVLIVDSEGNPDAVLSTQLDGTYRSFALTQGTYFASVDAPAGFVSELYDDIPCLDSSCVSTKGTPIVVSPEGDTTGIDFGLESFTAGLVGTVLDGTTGLPMTGVAVQIWDASGNPAVRRTTRSNGAWFANLPPGTYFASTDAGSAFPDQVYRGVFCDGPCDPLAGTPLTVGADTVIRAVDFRLAPVAIFTDGFESGDLSGWRLAP